MKREDWLALEKQLTWPGARASLQCDGYRVTLMVQRDKMRMVIAIYVNGWFRGEWVRDDCEERRRFMRPKTECAMRFNKADLRLGKRWIAKMKAKYSFTWYSPIWPSVQVLRRHFEKHNTSIELATADAPAELQAADVDTPA
jgi:hypothetical protein